MTTDFPTLPTGPLPYLAMDYARLRAEGMRLLGQLGGQQWTDFNTHDPGITILEQLCYAISDLGYRTNFPMADLLAASQHRGLPGPAEILVGEPVTRGDLRKRVLDVTGIANAWIEDPEQPELAFYHHVGSNELRLQPDVGETDAKPVRLRGLHRVLLQTSDRLSADAALEQVSAHVHQGRLLGEDYQLTLLKSFDVWLRASVEVGPLEDPVEVLADIVEGLENYLAPAARFMSLAEGRARGRRIDELFEGPLLEHGFIDELPAPRRTVYVSDLLHAITDVPQVRAVRSLELSTSASAARATWVLEVPAGHAATLASTSELILLRAGLPVRVDLGEVRGRLVQRRIARASGAADMREIQPPLGRVRALARHRSIRRQLPAAYGIGPLGLPDSAPAQRRAQARQLEAYLLIFDQLLANGFAQLAHAHELLSPDEGGTRTYFAQPVDDPPLTTTALIRGDLDDQQAWLDAVIEPGDPLERRKRFLAHLLARFAEQIGDHTHIAGTGGSDDPDAQIVRDRQTFLRHYPELSGARGSGYDLQRPEATAVLEQRLRLKLGRDDQRFLVIEHVLLRPLAEDVAQRVEEGEEEVPLLAGVNTADPFSLQVSYVFEDRSERDVQFEQMVAQTILAETPAHLIPRLHWFGAAIGAGDVDHWAAISSAWTEFKQHYAAYRAASLLGSVPTQVQLWARDARDRVIDLLGFGRTYPLRDIPLPPHVIVAPGTPTQITLEFSQRDVIYELRDREGKVASTAEGTGGALILPTPPIEDDVSYQILAIKREGANDPELRRAAWLRGSVRVEEGVDPTLVAQLRLPLLDSRIDAPKPNDARIADYATDVEVEILLSQEGVTYELLNHAKLDQKLSEPVVGTSGTIVLVYPGVKEDIDLRVRGSKAVGNPQSPEIRTALLDLILPLRVRARPSLAAVLNPAIVAHAGSSSLELSATQKSASYRVWQRVVRDSEVVFESAPTFPTIEVADGDRSIRIKRADHSATWVDVPGFSPRGDAQPGSGTKLVVDLGAFERDTILLVEAIKQHRVAPLTGEDPSTLGSAVQLDKALALLVRPNHRQALRLQVAVADAASSGPWLIMAGQDGVYYGFARAGQAAFSRLAYFHQRDDLDSRFNKGIGQLRIGVDLSIARDRPEPGDRSTTPPPLPSLDSPPLPVDTLLTIVARKAMTGLTAALDESATLFPVPAIAAAPVTAGEPAKIVVTASVVGDRYTLLRDETTIGEPAMGTGVDLELSTDAITERTSFQVAIERVGVGIPIVRRVAVTVEIAAGS